MRHEGSVSTTARVFSLLMLLMLLVPTVSSFEKYPAFSTAAFAAGDENGDMEDPFAKEHKPVVASDPLEPMNRAFFQFNDKLYFWCLKPISTVYAGFVPEGVRGCFRNAFRNLQFPIRFFNNLFQGKPDRAGVEFGRFIINSTLGMAGFFEIAARDFNLPPYEEDFGQTLGYYGAGTGAYIVWPVLGPCSIRDSFGLIGDAAFNPVSYLPFIQSDALVNGGIKAGRTVNGTSLRIGEYEDFKKSALDPYVSIRDAYFQYRAEEIQR